jgi:hypothetical protein
MRKYLLTLHRWFGIIGGTWILVLGVSGLMLDHRDDRNSPGCPDDT